MPKITKNVPIRFIIKKRNDKQGFIIGDKLSGNQNLPSNFTKNVSSLIREIEIITKVKKYFENATQRSNLDGWFLKKQELFQILAIGIYNEVTGANTQCLDIEKGI